MIVRLVLVPFGMVAESLLSMCTGSLTGHVRWPGRPAPFGVCLARLAVVVEGMFVF